MVVGEPLDFSGACTGPPCCARSPARSCNLHSCPARSTSYAADVRAQQPRVRAQFPQRSPPADAPLPTSPCPPPRGGGSEDQRPPGRWQHLAVISRLARAPGLLRTGVLERCGSGRMNCALHARAVHWAAPSGSPGVSGPRMHAGPYPASLKGDNYRSVVLPC